MAPQLHSIRPRAFTIVELAAVVFSLIVVVVAVLFVTQPSGRATARPLKDATQVRNLLQSVITFSQNNAGNYPLPSKIDPNNTTVASPDDAKDTTGNILSILIFNGHLSPEACISPAESNTQHVQKMKDYQFALPKAAVDPAKALWDPRFRGTPIDPAIAGRPADAPGNQSYAYVLPIGERLKQWRDSSSTDRPVLGNRGPQYAPNDFAPTTDTGRWPLPSGPLGAGSNTLLIHGGRTTWEGVIAYSDGHVQFETKPNPDSVTYKTTLTTNWVRADNLFVNESDQIGGDTRPGQFELGTNAYLRPIAERAATSIKVWID